MTLLDRDEHLGVRVLCANGLDFTAGLDVPKFFDPNATVKPRKQGHIDPSVSPAPAASHSQSPCRDLLHIRCWLATSSLLPHRPEKIASSAPAADTESTAADPKAKLLLEAEQIA
ncbi:MAG: hypothetical protein AB7I42_05575 [Bradyrhizobium sp.]|uniref:hypothetical protein n=1 Tax=Bradyrhizobium sp. TaxID=376 RepID=UPI003D0F9F26